MNLQEIAFTSIRDENKVYYIIDIKDPLYNPSLYDPVTIKFQLIPYTYDLMNVVSLVQAEEPVRIFDAQCPFPLQRSQGRNGWRSRMHHMVDDDFDEDTRSTGSFIGYFAPATPVPLDMRYCYDEQEGLAAPMEVEEQPPEESCPMFGRADTVPFDQRDQPSSPPDLFYMAIKVNDDQGGFVVYQYKGKNQDIHVTPAFKMGFNGKTDKYQNLITCLEENPQLKVLLAEKVIPLLLKFVSNFGWENLTGEDISGHSSVESMDTSDGPPPNRDVVGLLGAELPPEETPQTASWSKAKAVARREDSGFTSMPHSLSLNQQLANEEERVQNEAELAHLWL